MLTPFNDLLAERSGALGAFTCYDLETALGVLRAAEAARAGVVLLVSAETLATPGGEHLAAAICAVADRCPVRACVQLDHVRSAELIEVGLNAGCTAIMADGSRLSLDENGALVAHSVRLAAPYGATVEAELGHVSGDEESADGAVAGALTDPAEVGDFIARTGAACLAVSVGNVHGRYATPPLLDWQRLAAIRSATAVPLSLHGASGLADDDVRRAVSAGIAKVNVNT